MRFKREDGRAVRNGEWESRRMGEAATLEIQNRSFTV